MTLGHLQGTAGKRMLPARSPGLVPDPSVTITLECQLAEIGNWWKQTSGHVHEGLSNLLNRERKTLGDGDIQFGPRTLELEASGSSVNSRPSLVYRSSSRRVRATQRNPQNKTTKTERKADTLKVNGLPILGRKLKKRRKLAGFQQASLCFLTAGSVTSCLVLLPPLWLPDTVRYFLQSLLSSILQQQLGH